ncbi:MAG TPA: hypothetical protein VIL64_02425 [Solirubrobacteraceae bacterium]|jgi:hypothetical protein
MDRTPVLWAIALFFAGTIVFGWLHRLTRHQPAGFGLAVQVGALALIVGAIVLVVRRRS